MAELDEENLIRHFLLGRLPDEERERLELRLLANEGFLARVDAVEDEIIDDFALGRLNVLDSGQFERHFLVTNERRERLRFASDFHYALAGLQSSADKGRAVNLGNGDYSGVWQWLRGRRALAFGLAFALLLAVSFLLWWSLLRGNPREQSIAKQEQRVEPSPNENVGPDEKANQGEEIHRGETTPRPAPPHPTPETHANESPRTAERPINSQGSTSQVLAVALEPGSLRGETTFKKILIPRGTKTVSLILHFVDDEEGAPRPGMTYQVEIQNGEIRTIYEAANLQSVSNRGGRVVSVGVPAGLLSAGNYRVSLRARRAQGNAESVGSYYFSVAESPGRNGGK